MSANLDLTIGNSCTVRGYIGHSVLKDKSFLGCHTVSGRADIDDTDIASFLGCSLEGRHEKLCKVIITKMIRAKLDFITVLGQRRRQSHYTSIIHQNIKLI